MRDVTTSACYSSEIPGTCVESSAMIRRIRELASEQTTCMFGAEKEARRCHRSIIGEFLRKEGWQVVDL